MRTLLAVMLFAVAVSVCHAEEPKQVEYGVSLDTSKVNLGQQVDQVAEALKKHMEGPLGMYYQAAVRKNVIVGGVQFWMGIGLFLLGAVGLVLGIGLGDSPDPHPTIILAVGVVLGPVLFACSITPYFCPEYAAMNDIISNLGALVR